MLLPPPSLTNYISCAAEAHYITAVLYWGGVEAIGMAHVCVEELGGALLGHLFALAVV